VAGRFRCNVLGIDGFDPFVRSAREWARARGVARLATFRKGDVKRVRERGAYDAALMIGFLGFADAAPLLRRQVAPGGVYIVDDAVLARRDKRLGWPSRADAHALFAELGDTPVRELVPPVGRVRAMNAEIETSIMFRATALAQEHPSLGEDLEDIVARQLEAGRVLESRLRPVLWLVRKGAGK
jgi:hypothetical protein